MNPHDILAEVYSVSAALELDDDRITCPTVYRLPPDLRKEIGEHKAALLALLHEARIGETDHGFWLPRRFVPPADCENERTCARHGLCPAALAGEPCARSPGNTLYPPANSSANSSNTKDKRQ
ncbi:MAG: hypothetical protein QM753_11860 [Thermomicrobiales bacterium]